MRNSRWRSRWTVCALGFAAILIVRLVAVAHYHAPGGDGLQYYALSQELIKDHRFAYAAPPAPLAWSRLPGYPLFLAKVAVRKAPLSLNGHLRRATYWNVVLDFMTALFCCLIVREVVPTKAARLVCFVLVVCCPLLIILSCFALTESLATSLAALNLWLALLSRRKRPILFAGLAGAVAGVSLLVRVDALSVTAACLVALMFPRRPLRTTVAAVVVFGLAAITCYSPWPIRNLSRFGAPHFEGTEWIAQDGRPLRSGIMKWMRSWASGRAGQCAILYRVANDLPVSPASISPEVYDSLNEAAAAAELFEAYNKDGLSAANDDAFTAMARERARRNPVREYIRLPLERAFALWEPVPEYDLPVRSRLLGLPALRSFYDAVDLSFYGLCIVGVIVAWRRNRGATLTLVAAIVGRTVIFSAAHPCPSQRYVVEAFPAILVFASIAVDATYRALGASAVLSPRVVR